MQKQEEKEGTDRKLLHMSSLIALNKLENLCAQLSMNVDSSLDFLLHEAFNSISRLRTLREELRTSEHEICRCGGSSADTSE